HARRHLGLRSRRAGARRRQGVRQDRGDRRGDGAGRDMTSLVQLRGVSKDFRGVLAISNIDLDIRAGEIHAILGENGAGKSTLMKVLAGVYQPSSGEMTLDGKPVTLSSPSDALSRGIAMVFQETNLVPSMSVAQNIYLGDEKLFNRL